MIKYYVEVTCNECGKVVTGDFMPENWTRSVAGTDVHFCSAKCQQAALDRIDDAYAKVFGRYLTDKEVDKFRKALKDRSKDDVYEDNSDAAVNP